MSCGFIPSSRSLTSSGIVIGFIIDSLHSLLASDRLLISITVFSDFSSREQDRGRAPSPCLNITVTKAERPASQSSSEKAGFILSCDSSSHFFLIENLLSSFARARFHCADHHPLNRVPSFKTSPESVKIPGISRLRKNFDFGHPWSDLVSL